MRFLFQAIAAVMMLAFATSASVAAEGKHHRVAIQVDQNDPQIMNLALNNAANIMEFYKQKGETVDVEIVTFGPGLHMLREDTSPVKDRIKQIADLAFPNNMKFFACGNTKEGMEKREGKPVKMISEAEMVPSGAVRLLELQEEGWSYLRP
ncbi:MAG: DsrE family protein [Afipia sp.]|jgi:intracellular sulfur oxidation DsrE/DsrF family protein